MPTAGPTAPTATQLVAFPSRTHETPASVFEPDGSGLARIVHWVPSQPATRVLFGPSRCTPTATHAVSDRHETAAKPLISDRLGLGRRLHSPSRRTTSVRLP